MDAYLSDGSATRLPGDYLSLYAEPHVKRLLHPGERIIFSDHVIKINRKGRPQVRILAVTSFTIYNLYNREVRRCIDLKLISSITISTISNEFVIHVPSEYDYRLNASRKVDACNAICAASSALGHPISITRVHEIDLSHYTTLRTHTGAKKQVSAPPVTPIPPSKVEESIKAQLSLSLSSQPSRRERAYSALSVPSTHTAPSTPPINPPHLKNNESATTEYLERPSPLKLPPPPSNNLPPKMPQPPRPNIPSELSAVRRYSPAPTVSFPQNPPVVSSSPSVSSVRVMYLNESDVGAAIEMAAPASALSTHGYASARSARMEQPIISDDKAFEYVTTNSLITPSNLHNASSMESHSSFHASSFILSTPLLETAREPVPSTSPPRFEAPPPPPVNSGAVNGGYTGTEVISAEDYQQSHGIPAGSSVDTRTFVSEPVAGNRVNLSQFEFLRVLGRGSYGKVLLVRHIDTQELLALKVLKKSVIVAREQVVHAQTERAILESVDHPFLIQLRYAFQTDSRLFLAMPFMPGGELFFHLRRLRRFPESFVRFYASEIILGIAHLHAIGIVYRDLKPENVLLDAEGHIKLSDFGLSKVLSGSSNGDSSPGAPLSSGFEGADTFCGTPEYLAPEVIRARVHGNAVDWWALGILLWELLTGRPPFSNSNSQLLYKDICEQQLQYPPYLSPLACSLISQLLERNPLHRLGAEGAGAVCSHPFFADVDWLAVLERRAVPPLIPVSPQCSSGPPEAGPHAAPSAPLSSQSSVRNPGDNVSAVPAEPDTSNFDAHFTQEVPTIISPPVEGDSQRLASFSADNTLTFEGFTFEPAPTLAGSLDH